MTPHAFVLTSCNPLASPPQIFIAYGSPLSVTHRDSLTPTSNLSDRFFAPSILHILKLSLNILFVNQLTDNNCIVSFTSPACFIYEYRTSELIGQGHRYDGNYYMDSLYLAPSHVPYARVDITSSSSFIEHWHRQLGHLLEDRLDVLLLSGVLGHVHVSKMSTCVDYKLVNSAFYL